MVRYLVRQLGEKFSTKYVIDIGSSSGVPTDPCFPYITNPNFSGLCIEGDKMKAQYLRRRVSQTMSIYADYITPQNIIEVFQNYNVPENLFLIKIDIDGFDLEILRKILTSQYQPLFFIAEINEKIPPPIHFEIKYSKNYKWDTSHCFGFSLQAAKNVFETNNYYIACLYEMNNILCIRKDQINLLPMYKFPRDINKMYKDEYVNNKQRESAFPWNKNVDHWLTIDDKELLFEQIKYYFTKVNDRSNFPIKTKVLDKDFILKIS